ncbi:MAG TPA: lysine--tRNA ligase [Candidatus Acidoferrales bacterium]
MASEALDQIQQRERKLSQIEALGFDPYPHRFGFTHTIEQILARYSSHSGQQLEAEHPTVKVCGRIVTYRLHGKAGFAHLLGQGKKLQIYVRLDAVGEKMFQLFQLLDLGDVIGAEGYLFRTRTGELTVHVDRLTLLAKALLPLPEKWHGLADVEIRHRQRYLDLIVNQRVREVFLRRSQIIRALREFLEARGYVEVETPMMQPQPGGAVARPFRTHHQALDLNLYLRIAPELYLKRLVVGGLDRVYEINRNFRNEGISTQHNPEFTMLEFYQAYADCEDMMALTEEMLTQVVKQVCGTTTVTYEGKEVCFDKWQRLSLREAIACYWPEETKPTAAELAEAAALRRWAARYNQWAAARQLNPVDHSASLSEGVLTVALFEAVAAAQLISPTLVYDFPAEVSPLAKRRDDDPAVAERFEVFAGGLELGNAFSELNNPVEQRQRFEEQLRDRALAEAVGERIDEDYLRALGYGMPPTGGEGIGVDRLAMLLTDSHSIREVILFPLLRPESGKSAGKEAADPDPAQGGTTSRSGAS